MTIKQNMINGLKNDITKISKERLSEFKLDAELFEYVSTSDEHCMHILTTYERLLALASSYWDEFVLAAPQMIMDLADYINTHNLRSQFLELVTSLAVACDVFKGSRQKVASALDALIGHTWLFLDYRRGKMVVGYNPLTKKWIYHNAKVYYADRTSFPFMLDQPIDRLSSAKKDNLIDIASDEYCRIMQWNFSYFYASPYVTPDMVSYIPNRAYSPEVSLVGEFTKSIIRSLADGEDGYELDLNAIDRERSYKLPPKGLKVELENASFIKEVRMFDGVTAWGEEYVYFVLKYKSPINNRIYHDVTTLSLTTGFWSHVNRNITKEQEQLLMLIYAAHTCAGYDERFAGLGAPVFGVKGSAISAGTEDQVVMYSTGQAGLEPYVGYDLDEYTSHWGITFTEEELGKEVEPHGA